MTPEELASLRLHLLGEDPVSLLKFHPSMPITDATWNNAENSFYENLQCSRTISSVPKEDIAKLYEVSPCKRTSILGLKFILSETNYAETEWENPANPTLGNDKIKPTYNIALKIIETLAQNNLIWAAAIPDIRPTETWKRFKNLPEGDTNGLPKNLTPKLANPKDLTLILEGKQKVLPSHPDFPAEMIIFNDIGLEIFKNKYLLGDIPFVCPLVGEDEIWCTVSYKGPLIIGNKSYLKLLESSPKEAQKLYSKASEDLFFYRSQSYDQELYDIEHFRDDYPEDIALLTNPGLGVKNKIKRAEQTISKSIAELIKSVLPTLSNEISESCEETEGLKIGKVTWDPKNGLCIEAKFKSKNLVKTIEIKSGKTKVFSNAENAAI